MFTPRGEAREMDSPIWIFGDWRNGGERGWVCLDWMECWVGLARKSEEEEEEEEEEENWEI